MCFENEITETFGLHISIMKILQYQRAMDSNFKHSFTFIFFYFIFTMCLYYFQYKPSNFFGNHNFHKSSIYYIIFLYPFLKYLLQGVRFFSLFLNITAVCALQVNSGFIGLSLMLYITSDLYCNFCVL